MQCVFVCQAGCFLPCSCTYWRWYGSGCCQRLPFPEGTASLGKKYETWPLTSIPFLNYVIEWRGRHGCERERSKSLGASQRHDVRKVMPKSLWRGGKAGRRGGGVRSAFCELARRTWQERRLRWGCKREVWAGASSSKLFEGSRFIAPGKGWEATGWVRAWLEKIGTKL